jgi:hypothetical protein
MRTSELGVRILVIESLVTWHDKIDAVFVECLGRLGAVTLVAPPGYLASTAVHRRIDIPPRLLRHETKLTARLNGIRILRYIRKTVRVQDYDAVVFLVYENISLALGWPKDEKTFLFTHNNIDNVLGSRIKALFYRLIGSRVTHLVFMDYIGQYIRDTFGGRIFRIPHPVIPGNIENNDENSSLAGPAKRETKVIFSPSTSTPASVQKELMEFASRSGGKFYVVCRGPVRESTNAWETHPYFDDLERRMRECDMVFLGAFFNYRVSSFAFEALKFGKPFVAPNGPFVRELKKEYPGLIFPITGLEEIASLNPDPAIMKRDQARYLKQQSVEVISQELGRLLKQGES